MNQTLKVILIVIGIIIFLAAALFTWAYFKVKLPDLAFSHDDTQSVRIEKVDAWLQQLSENNLFNGGVLLIKKDSVLLKKTYGFEDYQKERPLTNSSMFRLASVSKQFTATGIMLLKEKDSLSFDDSITKYLPELPYHNVKVRHLLNHTSGIPDVYMEFPETQSVIVGDLLTNEKVVAILARLKLPLEFEPNANFKYSNTGYVLLSAIIERVRGLTFESYMKTELFEKLEMDQTRVWNLVSKDTAFLHKTESFNNVLGEITPLKPSVVDGVSGDGSIFSSLNDFEKWNQFWYDGTIISKDILDEACTAPKLKDGKCSDYGFGWMILKDDAHWHNGAWLGARTIIIRNTTLRNCLVILDNSSTIYLDDIAAQLAKVLK